MRIARPRLRRPTAPLTSSVATALAASVVALGLSACGSGQAAGRSEEGPLAVVAAENVWGSIASQLGGAHVEVTSVIDRPDADPHDYEPTASDARAIASADLVVINGLGYDTWATKLVDANPSPERGVVTVADLQRDGDNPHLWYDPDTVQAAVTAITAEYARLDPSHADDYAANANAFRTGALADYTAVIEDIRTTYAGTRIAASESIVAPLARSLRLELVTPNRLLAAVSEGVDPTAADKRTADAQINSGSVAAYVLNTQNSTPDVRAQVEAARAAGVAVTTVTETLPSATTFQQWQTDQLEALRAALAQSPAR